MHNKKSVKIFIGIFIVILLYPLYGIIFDGVVSLSGVSNTVEMPKFTAKDFVSGEYQTNLNSWIDENFGGRKFLIKLRSEIMYSLFHESPNQNVVLGKDGYLFQDTYINHELGLVGSETDDICTDLVAKLEKLNALFEENGKELYIFITPSKAHFCKDKIPAYYDGVMDENVVTYYDRFTQLLPNTDLRYFDGHAYAEEYLKMNFDAPLFYSTGIHWSTSYGSNAARAFSEYISSCSDKWNLGKVTLTEELVDEPLWPDADLFESLNLLHKPKGPYYAINAVIDEEGDKPNVFMRGGSFLGQSLNTLVRAGMFNQDVHFENYYYFVDQYSFQKTLSGYTAYDEVDNLDELLAQTDIMILEVNEANIPNMSWGFIDFLLENPEFIANKKG